MDDECICIVALELGFAGFDVFLCFSGHFLDLSFCHPSWEGSVLIAQCLAAESLDRRLRCCRVHWFRCCNDTYKRKIRMRIWITEQFKHGNHLNARQAWYSNGLNMSGCQMVWFRNGVLKSGQKCILYGLKCLVRQIMWSDHKKTQ